MRTMAEVSHGPRLSPSGAVPVLAGGKFLADRGEPRNRPVRIPRWGIGLFAGGRFPAKPAALHGRSHQIDSAAKPELFHRARLIGFHRLRADFQGLRDFSIAVALRDHPK